MAWFRANRSWDHNPQPKYPYAAKPYENNKSQATRNGGRYENIARHMFQMKGYTLDWKCFIVSKLQPWLMGEADGLIQKGSEAYCVEAKCCNPDDCLTSYDELDSNTWSQRVYWHQIQMTMIISGRRCYYSYLDNSRSKKELSKFRR